MGPMSKKQAILDTALRLFVVEGFEATATARIAAEAGVATGTLFHHFKNKDQLVNALYLDIKADITAALTRALEEGGRGDLRDRAWWVFTGFVRWAIAEPERFRFNSIFCDSPTITRDSRRHMVELTSPVTRALVEDGHARGVLRDLPPALLLSYASKLMVETARYVLEHPGEVVLDDSLISRPAPAGQAHHLLGRAFDAYWQVLTVDG